MTVPRHVKRARRALVERVEVIDRPWIIDTLLPVIAIGLIFWAAGLAGVIAVAGVR